MRTKWISIGEKNEPVPGNESNVYYKDVAEGLKKLRNEPLPYSTYVVDMVLKSNWIYQLCTTSKDIHLGIGRMDQRLQWQFASMLHEEMERGGGADQVMLLLEGKYILVTKMANSSGEVVALHLAPSR